MHKTIFCFFKKNTNIYHKLPKNYTKYTITIYLETITKTTKTT